MLCIAVIFTSSINSKIYLDLSCNDSVSKNVLWPKEVELYGRIYDPHFKKGSVNLTQHNPYFYNSPFNTIYNNISHCNYLKDYISIQSPIKIEDWNTIQYKLPTIPKYTIIESKMDNFVCEHINAICWRKGQFNTRVNELKVIWNDGEVCKRSSGTCDKIMRNIYYKHLGMVL